MPPVAPAQATAPMMPRRPNGARSTMKMMEVLDSPPTEMPWIRRSSVSSTGAIRPRVW
jgi:hypothetical protein